MNKKEKKEVEKTDVTISVRLSSDQMEQLKKESQKENRTISNFIKTKLF